MTTTAPVLTRRQHAVLTLIADGMSNAAIGGRLRISENTVKTLAKHIFGRLGANDRAHAVAIGFRTGLLGVEREARTNRAYL
jgi:DNA-binding NarL/FixJ family response regulator